MQSEIILFCNDIFLKKSLKEFVYGNLEKYSESGVFKSYYKMV